MRMRYLFTSLRKRADFSRVHSQGRRKGDALLQVRALARSGDTVTTLRLGMVVSKRYGGAVARNRFKRLVRAALREVAPQCEAGWDILVLPRAATGIKVGQMVASLRRILADIGILKMGQEPGEGVGV